MRLELFEIDKHYKTLMHWWKKHNWPEIPQDALPKTGFVAVNPDGKPVAMGFLYQTDSVMGVCEWFTRNPDMDPGIGRIGIDWVIGGIQGAMKALGIRTLFTSTNNEKLMTRLESFGFFRTDQGMTNLLYNKPQEKGDRDGR